MASVGVAPPHQRSRPVGRWLVTALIMALGVLWPTPAGAHTALLDSSPADRSVLQTAPDSLLLLFAEPVDPHRTGAQLVAGDGATVMDLRVVDDDTQAAEIAFDLPYLEAGLHGVVWETFGPDGHRVSGEVVFHVGPAANVDFDAVSLSGGGVEDTASSIASGVGAVLFLIGAALVAGTLYAAAVSRYHSGVVALVRDRALIAVVTGLALRWVAASWRLLRDDLSWSGVNDVVLAPLGLSSLFAAQAIAFAVAAQRSIEPFDHRRQVKAGAGCLWLVLGMAGYGYVGHAATLADRPWNYSISVAHVSAIILWAGPLVVLLSNRVRAGRDDDYFVTYRRAAPWLVGIVAVSGLALAEQLHGLARVDTRYGAALLTKIAIVIAVVAPLGWWNHRRTRDLGGQPRFVRAEVAAVAVVASLGATLGVMVPAVVARLQPAPAVGVVVLEADSPTSIEQCRSVPLGQATCYRQWFFSVMQSEGVTAAVDQIDASRADHPFVAQDCHQLAHDLGADAVELFGSAGAALAYEASKCFSGYYHGVVETSLGALTAAELGSAVGSMCDGPKDKRFGSFEHFNCLHGVGHGLMLVLESSVFDALSVCERFESEPEQRMCSSGVFMENVNWSIEGAGSEATIDAADPLFPCNAVDAKFAEDCVLNQTGHWTFGLDLSKTDQLAACVSFETVDPILGPACARAVGRDANGQSQRDLAVVLSVCSEATGEYRDQCIWGAAQDLVLLDADPRSADALCAALEDVDSRLAGECRAARDAAGALL